MLTPIPVLVAIYAVKVKAKTSCTPLEAIEIVTEHVRYARSLGLKVRYTPEDATRTDFEFLVQICNAAIEA